MLPEAVRQCDAFALFHIFAKRHRFLSEKNDLQAPENARKKIVGDVVEWRHIFIDLDCLTEPMNKFQPWLDHLKSFPSVEPLWRQRALVRFMLSIDCSSADVTRRDVIFWLSNLEYVNKCNFGLQRDAPGYVNNKFNDFKCV